MSHLSILPTVYTDIDRLAEALRLEGFLVQSFGCLEAFDSDPVDVDLLALHSSEIPLGWNRRPDGTISLHGDLQRISRYPGFEASLQRVARRYALLSALAQVELGSLSNAELIVQPL